MAKEDLTVGSTVSALEIGRLAWLVMMKQEFLVIFADK